MAEPNFKASLDGLDKLSVCLYRLGICFFSITCLSFASVLCLDNGWISFLGQHFSMFGFAVASFLCANNIHVYNKYVRCVIASASWLALLVMIIDREAMFLWLSLGLVFVSFSGIALKESFCFKVPGLRLVPIMLILSVIGLMFQSQLLTAICLFIVGGIYCFLGWKKCQMPLHFDIGNKANYQI